MMKGDMIFPWEDQEADVNDSLEKDALDILAKYNAHAKHMRQLEAYYWHCKDTHSIPDMCCPDVDEDLFGN